MKFSFPLLVALGACVLLIATGCGQTALTRTISDTFPIFGADLDSQPLNPNLRYLRVSVQGRTALMVLGYQEAHAAGPIDIWYSAEGETLRLQNGRIVGTAGLATDWRAVRWPSLPSWSALRQQARVEFRRERDEMPGYRFGIVEDLVLRRLILPEDTELVGWTPEELTWFEERKVGAGGTAALYALTGSGKGWRVVYSEQCLSTTLCLAWQEWPVQR